MIMTEKEIEELYGKSIWNMTASEIIDNGLEKIWLQLMEEEK